MQSDVRTLKKYVAFTNEKRELEDRLVAVKAQLMDLEPRVLEYFQRHGLDRVAVDGISLSPRCDERAGREDGVTTEECSKALYEAGLDEFAGVNWQGLSAYLKELKKDEKPMHPALVGK